MSCLWRCVITEIAILVQDDCAALHRAQYCGFLMNMLCQFECTCLHAHLLFFRVVVELLLIYVCLKASHENPDLSFQRSLEKARSLLFLCLSRINSVPASSTLLTSACVAPTPFQRVFAACATSNLDQQALIDLCRGHAVNRCWCCP